jgi:hypothetical protein
MLKQVVAMVTAVFKGLDSNVGRAVAQAAS